MEWLIQRQLLSGQTSQKQLETVEETPKQPSVHFSSCEVSMNIPVGSVPRSTRNKSLGRINKTSTTPVALQKVIHDSNYSDTGDSIVTDVGVDSSLLPQWEVELLVETIDFTDCQIDPAPFQLVETTSLYKVHKLFHLLNLTHAYVTTVGRLVGIVTLEDIRSAIDNERPFIERRFNQMQSGDESMFDSQSMSSLSKPRANTEPIRAIQRESFSAEE